MKAIVQRGYGGTDVLEFADVDRPTAGPGEVVLRVHAAGVDRGTWHLMAGLPYVARPVIGLRRPKNLVPGLDVAGVVEDVGAEVTRFRPGDEVFGIAAGSFAEHARATEAKLAAKPPDLGWPEAAALGISGLTALQAVRDKARVRPGERVLVLGASGGVGSYAVQIAKTHRAHVTGACSTAKTDFVRGLGADDVVDYTAEDVTDGRRRWDVVLDIGGNRTIRALRRALMPSGRLVIIGGEGGGRLAGGVDRQLRATLLSPFVRHTMGTLISSENARDLEALAELVRQGEVTPAVETTFALADAAAAVEHVSAGRARGKVALVVIPGTTP